MSALANFMKKLFGQRSFRGLDDTLFMKRNGKYGAYEIGEWTYGQPDITWGGGTFRIGRYCSIGSGVRILTGSEHRTTWVSTYPFKLAFPGATSIRDPSCTKGDVSIGHDVWIGNDAMILSGVVVGNGAVIGARALVTKDVAPYSIVGGVPARLVRDRFDQATIEALQSIAWWDWPLEKVEEALPLLQSADVSEFISRHGGTRGSLL
jgi:acetyltransferase-like isoleucine patch superfamily enzyme